MCAAENNRLDVVKFLLDDIKTNIDVNAVDTDQQTALHLAATGGHTEIVRELVHMGASLTLVDKVI